MASRVYAKGDMDETTFTIEPILEIETKAPENIKKNKMIKTVAKLAMRAFTVNAVTNDAIFAEEMAARESDIICNCHDRPQAPKSSPSIASGSLSQMPSLLIGPRHPDAL